MSLAIGQGAVTMTPLKVAQMVTGFARPDGKQVVPRLVQTQEPPQLVHEYELTREQIASIRKGMRMVMGPGGTAWDVMRDQQGDRDLDCQRPK